MPGLPQFYFDLGRTMKAGQDEGRTQAAAILLDDCDTGIFQARSDDARNMGHEPRTYDR